LLALLWCAAAVVTTTGGVANDSSPLPQPFSFLSLSTRDMLMVVIVSTLHHGELLAAHAESTARVFRVFTATERDVPECVYPLRQVTLRG
jgi:hypothetical protein